MREARYSSVSAVIQQGLELPRQKTDGERMELKAVRALFSERRVGAFVSLDEMQERVSQMLERKRREHGLDD